MIRINAIVLLAVFTMLLVRPALPYLEYLIRKNFIIENLCINKEKPESACNGKCHLKNQIQKETDQSDENPYRPLREHNKIIDYIIWEAVDEAIHSCEDLIKAIFRNTYTFQFIRSIFRPPM